MIFGWGVLNTAKTNRKLYIAGILIIFYSILNFYWPPMHQREVIAAGGGTLTDTLHIVWTIVHLALMLLMIGFGTAALGKGFRIYSATTIIVFLVFGILTSMESPGIEANKPT